MKNFKPTANFLFGSLLFTLGIFGCAHPPAQSTPDLKRFQQIDRFVEDLRLAFEARDTHRFTLSLAPDHQTGLEGLSDVLKGIRKPRLEFNLDRIVLEEKETRVNLHWELNWLTREEREIKQRGNAEFVLMGDQDLMLSKILGDNPFTAPGNILETSS